MLNKIYYINIGLVACLFLAEFLIDIKDKRHLYKRKETLNSLIIGVGLFLVGFVSRGFVLSAYCLVYSVRIFTIPNSIITWLLAYLLYDFSFYWYHRASHTVNWFWAAHSVHHSAQHLNIAVGFRQSWTTAFSGYFIFYLWLPFIGFNPEMVYFISVTSLFYSEWLHTELIGKLHPVIEWIFNTPSHHRVHHGSDLKYLDKNHGEVLIIWDRIFGTFQEEEEKPTYGLTKKNAPENAPGIIFGEWQSLFSNMASCGSLKTAFNYIIQPPGWSHDGSSKTVKELRMEAKQGRNAVTKKCKTACSQCGLCSRVQRLSDFNKLQVQTALNEPLKKINP